jgi:hypothetical protein
MRLEGAIALSLTVLLAGCAGGGGGGWLGFGKKSNADDGGQLITKPIGPGLVSRCPVPVAYDDGTSKKIQDALDALPKDSVLRKAMSDYEAERDNLRMCQ